MVASSAAPLKQCPPSPTSPQAPDPTSDTATIQTGAPLYEEPDQEWLTGKEREGVGRRKRGGFQSEMGMIRKIESCVHSRFSVFSSCLGCLFST